MRVFYINSVCEQGSTGRIFKELARRVIARGGEAEIAFGRGASPAGLPFYRIGNRFSFYMHVLGTRLTDRQGMFSRVATADLIRRMRSYGPDIVHLGNLHGYYLNVPMLADYLKESGVPVVWTLHDCWSFTGHCSHFTDVGCDRWKTGCCNCVKRGVYPASWIFDRSRRMYAKKRDWFSKLPDLTLVAPSRWLGDCVAESFLADVPLRVLENGVDLAVFRPTDSDFRERHGLTGKRIALGVATPWDERKGLYDCVRLAGLLSPDWTVVLVALTEKQRRALPGHMLGLPRTDSVAELAEIYGAADVYVNPTYCDTFPTTNLEALACGTPVVTYRAGGSPEALDDSCGIVVPMGDVPALAEAVGRAALLLRADCVRRAEMFGKDARFLPYFKLYDELLGRARA